MSSLVVTHLPAREAERQCVCDVVLRDWLGVDYATLVRGAKDTRITVAGYPRGRPPSSPGAWPDVCATRDRPTGSGFDRRAALGGGAR
jgi:hypothetical protein